MRSAIWCAAKSARASTAARPAAEGPHDTRARLCDAGVMFRYRLVLVGVLAGCPNSDDAVTVGGSSSGSASTESGSSVGPTTMPGTEGSSGIVTGADTSCAEDCPPYDTSASETSISSESSGSSEGSSSSGSAGTTTIAESSSEGPMSVCGDSMATGSEECDD